MSTREGYDALWLWFGLSRANFLTVPRALMHEMPDGWQARMAELLNEYNEAFDFSGMDDPITTHVSFKRDGKYVRGPDWALNYRHPDKSAIDFYARARPSAPATPEQQAIIDSILGDDA